MPVVRVSDPALLPDLVEELKERADCIAETIGPDRLAVNVLGSYRGEAMRMEVELRIRAWQAAQRSRGVDVDVEFEGYS
ncbi:MAG: hypothetical protein ACJ757_13710 [Gaiellaceae bacterium]